MRLDRVWIVAKKDMAEFRTNKYVMFSLVLMPLLLALVLPIIYLAPFTLLSEPTQLHELDLPDSEPVVGQSFSNTHVSNMVFEDCVFTNVTAEQCRFEKCDIGQSMVRSSFLGNSTFSHGALIQSNVLNITMNSTVASDIRSIGGESESVTFLRQFINFLMLFFILIPAIIPTVIASYSFVGEKLNRSLEPLLATPTTDAELLAGKSLSIFLPCILVTWLTFLPFVLLVNFLVAPVLGFAPLPDLSWLIGVFLLAPLFCVMSIALNVIVSSKVTDVRASQQLGSLVVLPVVMLFVVSLSGLFDLGPLVMLALTALVGLVDVGIAYLTVKTFRREEILVRWK